MKPKTENQHEYPQPESGIDSLPIGKTLLIHSSEFMFEFILIKYTTKCGKVGVDSRSFGDPIGRQTNGRKTKRSTFREVVRMGVSMGRK